ncbi:hypothetical protein HDV00_000834 [Rhizophlyctis rosea]|nr:hypothetical protein HDV00_000834 [Rhizophlyctis rosea]
MPTKEKSPPKHPRRVVPLRCSKFSDIQTATTQMWEWLSDDQEPTDEAENRNGSVDDKAGPVGNITKEDYVLGEQEGWMIIGRIWQIRSMPPADHSQMTRDAMREVGWEQSYSSYCYIFYRLLEGGVERQMEAYAVEYGRVPPIKLSKHINQRFMDELAPRILDGSMMKEIHKQSIFTWGGAKWERLGDLVGPAETISELELYEKWMQFKCRMRQDCKVIVHGTVPLNETQGDETMEDNINTEFTDNSRIGDVSNGSGTGDADCVDNADYESADDDEDTGGGEDIGGDIPDDADYESADEEEDTGGGNDIGGDVSDDDDCETTDDKKSAAGGHGDGEDGLDDYADNAKGPDEESRDDSGSRCVDEGTSAGGDIVTGPVRDQIRGGEGSDDDDVEEDNRQHTDEKGRAHGGQELSEDEDDGRIDIMKAPVRAHIEGWREPIDIAHPVEGDNQQHAVNKGGSYSGHVTMDNDTVRGGNRRRFPSGHMEGGEEFREEKYSRAGKRSEHRDDVDSGVVAAGVEQEMNPRMDLKGEKNAVAKGKEEDEVNRTENVKDDQSKNDNSLMEISEEQVQNESRDTKAQQSVTLSESTLDLQDNIVKIESSDEGHVLKGMMGEPAVDKIVEKAGGCTDMDKPNDWQLIQAVFILMDIADAHEAEMDSRVEATGNVQGSASDKSMVPSRPAAVNITLIGTGLETDDRELATDDPTIAGPLSGSKIEQSTAAGGNTANPLSSGDKQSDNAIPPPAAAAAKRQRTVPKKAPHVTIHPCYFRFETQTIEFKDYPRILHNLSTVMKKGPPDLADRQADFAFMRLFQRVYDEDQLKTLNNHMLETLLEDITGPFWPHSFRPAGVREPWYNAHSSRFAFGRRRSDLLEGTPSPDDVKAFLEMPALNESLQRLAQTRDINALRMLLSEKLKLEFKAKSISRWATYSWWDCIQYLLVGAPSDPEGCFLKDGRLWYRLDDSYVDHIGEQFSELMATLSKSAVNWDPGFSKPLGAKEWDYNLQSLQKQEEGWVFVHGDTIIAFGVELFDFARVGRDKTLLYAVKRGLDGEIRVLTSQIAHSMSLLRSGNAGKIWKEWLGRVWACHWRPKPERNEEGEEKDGEGDEEKEEGKKRFQPEVTKGFKTQLQALATFMGDEEEVDFSKFIPPAKGSKRKTSRTKYDDECQACRDSFVERFLPVFLKAFAPSRLKFILAFSYSDKWLTNIRRQEPLDDLSFLEKDIIFARLEGEAHRKQNWEAFPNKAAVKNHIRKTIRGGVWKMRTDTQARDTAYGVQDT